MPPGEATPFTIDVLTLARHAGLDTAAAEFPEDVAAAAQAAAQAQAACAGAGQPTDEPWPPMRVRGREEIPATSPHWWHDPRKAP
jgi:hypothetical protein